MVTEGKVLSLVGRWEARLDWATDLLMHGGPTFLYFRLCGSFAKAAIEDT